MRDMPFFVERRSFMRFPVKIPASYLEPDANNMINTQTYDISAQGLCLLADRQLPPGTFLDICLRMADNGEQIYRKGEVVWSNTVDSGNCIN
jgi:hypothetical protein